MKCAALNSRLPRSIRTFQDMRAPQTLEDTSDVFGIRGEPQALIAPDARAPHMFAG
jgi:hypothetical protein